ncbi:hypothetical protein HPB48_026266 [Haemaphysalis longicornis]|uniref:GGDEF domain-containing protein n=1 Tax=Haemaphysalis longicornis TaxID=44386 RepID=A0A9J6HBG0_HAELO|nr:hypothetical protein HPB48_026266 [Haemaphysalis longicornis]
MFAARLRNALECFRSTAPQQKQRRGRSRPNRPRSLESIVEEFRDGTTTQECLEIFVRILAGIFARGEALYARFLTKNDGGWPQWMMAGTTTKAQGYEPRNLEHVTEELWCNVLCRSSPSTIIGNYNPTIKEHKVPPVDSGSSLRTHHCYLVGDYGALIIVMSPTSTWSQLQRKSVCYVLRELALRLRELELEKWIAVENYKSTLLTSRAYEVQSASLYFTALLLNSPISVAFMDLDNFKKLNSKLTHLEADVILRCVGKMIREVVSSETYCEKVVPGHIGGDEFMFTILGHDEFARDFMRSVLCHFEHLHPDFSNTEVHEKFQEFKEDHGFTASVGISAWKWDGDSSVESSTTCVEKFKQARIALEENARRANKTLLIAKENKTRRRGGNVLLWRELSK